MKLTLKGIGLLFLLVSLSCNNEVELNAPAKNILIVYGVLNPDATEQYIRISKVFTTETNAINYASTQDVSLNSSQVQVYLNGVTLRDTVFTRSSGTFTAGMRVFKITDAELDIVPGSRYQLQVNYLEDPGASVSAYTTVPFRPSVIQPITPTYTQGGLNMRNYPLEIEKSFKLYIRKSQYAKGYEVRMTLNFFENGLPRAETWFANSSNYSVCTADANSQCFDLRNGIGYAFFKGKMSYSPFPNYYTMIDTPQIVQQPEIARLNRSFRVHITAVDTFLQTYMDAASANTSSLSTSFLEYSNVKGGLGILGSYSEGEAFYDLSPCSMYLLGINNTPRPATACKSPN